MSIVLEEYISGGYLITQPVDGVAPNQWLREFGGVTEDLLPSQFFSVGMCAAKHAPVFGWVDIEHESYIQFGVPMARIPELNAWADIKSREYKIGYPNLFIQLDVAREYLQRFTAGSVENHILGIALHKSRLDQIAKLERRYPSTVGTTGAKIAGFGERGFAQSLKLDKPSLPGEILGFDVICCETGIDHSWICNGFAADGLQKFGFRPNQFGLIDEKSDADKMTDYAQTRGETGEWLPVLVSRFSNSPYAAN
jgi:hypothetical protein